MSECWQTKKQHVKNTAVAKMKMLRWMIVNLLKDRINNEFIHKKLEVPLGKGRVDQDGLSKCNGGQQWVSVSKSDRLTIMEK